MDYASESRDGPGASSPSKRVAAIGEDDSDTDFQEEKVASEVEEEDSGNETEVVNVEELQPNSRQRGSRSRLTSQVSPAKSESLFWHERKLNVLISAGRTFKRVKLSPAPAVDGLPESTSHVTSAPPQPLNEVDKNIMPVACLVCSKQHPVGYCPLKHAGVENCPLCGIPHYGHFRTCPHLSSLTQCRRMLEALKQSTEPAVEKKLAKQYIVGIIGDLTRRKRLEEQKAQQEAGVGATQAVSNTHTEGTLVQTAATGVMPPTGMNGGMFGILSPQPPAKYSTYPIPNGFRLANGDPHLNGFAPGRAGRENQAVNGFRDVSGNTGANGLPSS